MVNISFVVFSFNTWDMFFSPSSHSTSSLIFSLQYCPLISFPHLYLAILFLSFFLFLLKYSGTSSVIMFLYLSLYFNSSIPLLLSSFSFHYLYYIFSSIISLFLINIHLFYCLSPLLFSFTLLITSSSPFPIL